MKFLLLLSVFLLPVVGLAATSQQAVESYAKKAYEDYSLAVERARALNTAIELFLAMPSQDSLENAKRTWIEARVVYSPTEVYRFYNGPIDHEESGPEGLINAWPLDEVYIDYVLGKPNSGIINDLSNYPQITKELLISLNEKDGEKNISTGYHAIEFLLWGQDLNSNGPGRRPVSDYIIGQGRNAQRRADYLRAASEILVDHLITVRDAWESNATYATGFVRAENTKESLKNIFMGAFRLSGEELSHERMFVAYDTQQQEDEHSCFSDTTHLDILYNFLGIERVLSAVDGPVALVREKDAAQADVLMEMLAKTKIAVSAIPAPFDRAIYSDEGRARILAAVTDLEDLAVEIKKSAAVLGITLE